MRVSAIFLAMNQLVACFSFPHTRYNVCPWFLRGMQDFKGSSGFRLLLPLSSMNARSQLPNASLFQIAREAALLLSGMGTLRWLQYSNENVC